MVRVYIPTAVWVTVCQWYDLRILEIFLCASLAAVLSNKIYSDCKSRFQVDMKCVAKHKFEVDVSLPNTVYDRHSSMHKKHRSVVSSSLYPMEQVCNETNTTCWNILIGQHVNHFQISQSLSHTKRFPLHHFSQHTRITHNHLPLQSARSCPFVPNPSTNTVKRQPPHCIPLFSHVARMI